MYKRYFLVFVLALCVITISFAQKTEKIKKTGGYARILGMGNNPYIIDPFYITVNPAWGAYYDNFLFGDLGSGAGTPTDFAAGGNGQFIVANFGIGGNFTIGGLLSRNDFNGFSIATLDPLSKALYGVVDRINSLSSVVPNIELNNNVELFSTLQLGSLALGLGVAYASTSNEINLPGTGGGTINAKANQLGINLGAVLNSVIGKFDAGVSIILPSASYDSTLGNKNASASINQYVIIANARFFSKFSSKLTLVPIFNFMYASTNNKNGAPKIMAYNPGVGINYIFEDFLLAGGLALINVSVTTPSTDVSPEFSTSNFVFPVWDLGLEWNMTDWFISRLGYRATTTKQTIERPISGSKSDVSESIQTLFTGPNGATLGVGFRFGSFSLDATVNEGVLRQGLNNIGGGGPTFAYLSASYALP